MGVEWRVSEMGNPGCEQCEHIICKILPRTCQSGDDGKLCVTCIVPQLETKGLKKTEPLKMYPPCKVSRAAFGETAADLRPLSPQCSAALAPTTPATGHTAFGATAAWPTGQRRARRPSLAPRWFIQHRSMCGNSDV